MQLFNLIWSAVGVAGDAIVSMSTAAYTALGVAGTQAVEVMSGVAKTVGLG